jgi:hypothetical protein
LIEFIFTENGADVALKDENNRNSAQLAAYWDLKELCSILTSNNNTRQQSFTPVQHEAKKIYCIEKPKTTFFGRKVNIQI